MSSRINVRPDAKADMLEQAEYINEDNPGYGARFLQAADAAAKLLLEMPRIGAIRRFKNATIGEVRIWPVKGFEKHLIFYRPTEYGIDVLRVLYASEDIDALLNPENL